MRPVKLNAVVVKGYNENDVIDLARLTIERPWQVRFIEMMPFAGVTDVQTGQIITAAQIQGRIEAAAGPPRALQRRQAGRRGAHLPDPGAKGNVGFISSVTAPFCDSCNRARLTRGRPAAIVSAAENEVDLLTTSAARGRLAGGPAAAHS